MSNTSWQRGVQDLTAAGLNPMLAYTKGGASTPTTTAAPVQTATMQSSHREAAHYSSPYTAALNSAMDGMRTQNDYKRLQIESEKLDLDKDLIDGQVKYLHQHALNLNIDSENKKDQHEEYSYRQPHLKSYYKDHYEQSIAEIKSRIAENYGNSTHAYSASALNKAQTEGQYSTNTGLKDFSNFITDNPKLFPRLKAFGEGTSSARNITQAITDIAPPTRTYKQLRKR
jgi:hypothetical protein